MDISGAFFAQMLPFICIHFPVIPWQIITSDLVRTFVKARFVPLGST